MNDQTTAPLRGILRLASICIFAALSLYMYLGTFSRYLSDDFCEAVHVREASPLGAVIDRYTDGEWRAANRYSNLLFVGFSEWLGPHNVQITTPLMILLWVIGLVWLIHEAGKLAGLSWFIEIDVLLGTTLAFFTLLQAPQLFQTIYWRSSMFTHFAPLVFGAFLLAFLLRSISRARHEAVPFWVHAIVLPASFVIAGFSEPPVAVMVTGLGLAMIAAWVTVDGDARTRILLLLGSAFAGAFLGLMVMIFSPASFGMLNGERPGLVKLLQDSFSFPFAFIQSTFKTLPLPSLISVIIPALLIWSLRTEAHETPADRKRLIWLAMITAPLLMYVCIAASFSPSVYGQGFPIERMRFAARCFLTICLMLEGGLFGWLVRDLFPASRRLRFAVAGLFAVIAIVYPVRAAFNLLPEIAEYRERAHMWDLRDAYIIRHAALGDVDIIVPGFSGVNGVKELDDDQTHWVNLCAANYYGVGSIRAVYVPDEYMLDYLDD